MRIRSMTVVGLGVAAFVTGAIALGGSGCGDDDENSSGGPDPVTVTGTVNSAIDETASAPTRPRWFAWWQPSEAVAQQECPVDSILACLETDLDAETPTASCSPVSPLTCQFDVDIELGEDANVRIFFVDDDGNNAREEGEAEAELQGGPENFCAGQTVTLSGVDISFVAMTAVASDVQSDPVCPTPTPTPEDTATPTATPTPTETPTP